MLSRCFQASPLTLSMDSLDKKWSMISEHTKILFFNIFRFVLIDSTFFDYGGNIYKQINGCAKGSNISPTIACNIDHNEWTFWHDRSEITFCAKSIVEICGWHCSKCSQATDHPHVVNVELISWTDTIHSWTRTWWAVTISWFVIDTRGQHYHHWLVSQTDTVEHDIEFLFQPLKMRTNVAYNLICRVLCLRSKR